MRIHVSRICNLALGGTVDAVNFAACEGFESGEGKGLAERIDACVFEELVARLVDEGSRGVALEITTAGDLAWEVVACVEEFEEAAYGVEVFVY